MMILVFVLASRVSQNDAEWAQKITVSDGLGFNCKTLILLFNVLAIAKFLVFADFIDPSKILVDGLEMTPFAEYIWKLIGVVILEIFLATVFTLLFEDESGHEVVVYTIIAMSLFAAPVITPMQQYMSAWMGLNSNMIWIRVGVMVAVSLAAILAGRRISSSRQGYQNIAK